MAVERISDFIGTGVGNNLVMFMHIDDLVAVKNKMHLEMRDNARRDVEGFTILPPTRKVMCRIACDFCGKNSSDATPIGLRVTRDVESLMGYFYCAECEKHCNASYEMNAKLDKIFDFAKIFDVCTDVEFFRQRIGKNQPGKITLSMYGLDVPVEFDDATQANRKMRRLVRVSNILHSTFGVNIPSINEELIKKVLEECAPLVTNAVQFYLKQLRDEYKLACDGMPVLE